MAGLFNNQNTLLAPDLAAQQQQLTRQQQMAQMLMQQGMQNMNQGTEVIGGWAIPKSGLGALANAAAIGAGGYMQNQAIDKQAELAKALQQQKLDAFSGMWGVQKQPEIQGRDIPTPLNLETGGGNVPPNPNDQPMHPLYAAALQAYSSGNEDLANKLFLNAFEQTPEMKNWAAKGVDMRQVGQLELGKMNNDATQVFDAGKSYRLPSGEWVNTPNAQGLIYDPVTRSASIPQGYSELNAKLKGEEAGAVEGAKANYAPYVLDLPGGKVATTIGNFVNQVTPKATPSNMRVPPATQAGRDQQAQEIKQNELAQLKDQLTKTTNPNEQAQIKKAIGAVSKELSRYPQQATQPQTGGIKLQSEEQSAFGKAAGGKAVDLLTETRAKAKAANDDILNTNEIRKNIKSGAFQGTGAELKTDAAKFAQGLGIPLPADFANKATNSDYLRSTMGSAMLANIKQLGANPTDADRVELQKIVGTLGKDPNAMNRLLDWRENQARRVIDSHNKDVAGAKERGLTMPMDYTVTPYQAPKAAATPAPAKQQTFDTLPNPAQFSGKRMKAPDGTIIRSNGKQWVKE